MTVLIVGAGFYGATMARALTDMGQRCIVVEKLPFLGGHCRTKPFEIDGEPSYMVHACGPHIFHTNDERAWRFVNRFAEFNGFVNRPKVRFGNDLYSFPINLATLHAVYGVRTPTEAAAVLAREREPIAEPRNMHEWCLANLGRRLYELFIEGYTTKQWGCHPEKLPATLMKRIPIRLNFDDRYFTDRFQGVPIGGYTQLITNMLDGIEVQCGVEYVHADKRGAAVIVYTGAIDEFFGYRHGPLTYRTLRFEDELVDVPDFQGNAVVNYTAMSVPFTRIVEHKHFESAGGARTLITREFSEDWRPGKEPFYPVNTPADRVRLEAYQNDARALRTVVFGGRLGGYQYLDMHQVIAAALSRAGAVLELARG